MSGKDDDIYINFYKQGDEKQGEEKHDSFLINKESAFYTYWTQGNGSDNGQGTLPLGQPTMTSIDGHRVIIFSRFMIGE